MTNEELREKLWNLESDMARMCANEYRMRKGFFDIIRDTANRNRDRQGNVLWDAVEAELSKSSGMITPPTGRTEYVPGIMTARNTDGA
jgi:hypothetical protein